MFSLELKLDEQYEAGGAAGGVMGADRAAEGKTWADGAAAEQANCIWLSSGETMTLNFLKKSMPRMGPATAACRKVAVKRFALKLHSLLNKAPRGDGLAICFIEEGARWA